MKKLLLGLVFLSLSSCAPFSSRQAALGPRDQNSVSPQPSSVAQSLLGVKDRTLGELQIGDQILEVEVVRTASSISQGLSGRTQIGADGMLFVFAKRENVSFWMKEMMFDLDLIWIANNQVVGVTKNVPHPDPQTPLSELPSYAPPEPVDLVLEVEAGQAEIWGVATGDEIQFLTAFNPSGES